MRSKTPWLDDWKQGNDTDFAKIGTGYGSKPIYPKRLYKPGEEIPIYYPGRVKARKKPALA